MTASAARPGAVVAAVVVTHNRLAALQVTVARLLTEPLDHIIIVDNASQDGTQVWLESLADPRLHLVLQDRNSGGAGGFEQGLRQAVALFDPDWCVVMDDDARPEAGAIAAFRAQDWSGAEAVAAAVYTPRGEICDMNRPSLNPFWHPKIFWRTALGGGRMGFHLPDSAYDAVAPQTIDAASFVGLFLSRRAIATAGLPDGRLFIYGDDVLYTLHLRQLGLPMVFAPGLRFEHDFKTIAAGSRAFSPVWKAYYHCRNLLMVYRVAAGPWFWPALLLILPKWALKASHYGVQRGAYLRLLRAAIRDGLTHRLTRSHDEVVALSQG